MNTFKIKLSVLVLGIAFMANAQVDSFKLADYKLPYLKRKALETSISLSGKNRNMNNEKKYLSEESTYKTTNFHNNLNIEYTDFVNIQKRQSQSMFSFDFLSDFSKDKSDNGTVTAKHNANMLQPVFHIQRIDRFYFVPKLFFELAPLADYKFVRYYTDNNNLPTSPYNENTRKMQDGKLQIALKFGKGRITQVQDARHAIYFLEAFKKLDRMKADLTNDEITELANLIAKLKNDRVYDIRLNDISDIQAVDSFFTAHDYISKSDAKYFTTLSDMWRYGNIYERFSGTRISFAVVPAFRFSSFDSSDKTSNSESVSNWNDKAFSIDAGFEFVHQKPIDLYWQHHLRASMYFGMMNGKQTSDSDNYDNKLEIPKIQMGLNHGVGFYPNTRTRIDMGYQFNYLKTFSGEDLGSTVMINSYGLSLSANLSADYYVSKKFRIRFSALAGFAKVDGDSHPNIINLEDDFTRVFYPATHDLKITDSYEITRFTAGFYLGLSYSIF